VGSGGGDDDHDDYDGTCRHLFSSSSDDDNDATYIPPLDESSTDSSDAPPFVDKPPKVQQSAGVRATGLSFPKDVASEAKPRTTAFGRSRCTERRDRDDVKRRRAQKTCPVDGCGQAKADIPQHLRHCHRHLTASERKQLLLLVPRATAVRVPKETKRRGRNRHRRRRPLRTLGTE
jgi:hypothetical protein